ncbi:hypothetical protein F3Y22_tig00112507pilonHSYRG00065 [Hibiscus syriacus]|uniref:Uncharacterized protein n=1 Tax=Hibiscus syriacus TaxID=106335 RepID=A0A6A2WWI1_HIBSY|nr:hypothetical protein F3Y22_tig00112507pilonHSYRG00065 [Hibiscus syriacus]
MGREMVMDSWFSGSWLNPRESSSESNGKILGILAFEVAGLISKVGISVEEDGEVSKEDGKIRRSYNTVDSRDVSAGGTGANS